MTYRDVYIGLLEDPKFSWQSGNWEGNAPDAISPLFPPAMGAFNELIDRIESGAYEGKQTDWEAWVAKVSKQQILCFIEDCYAGDRNYTDPTYMPHLYDKMQELLRHVESLDNHKIYALVASEL